MKKVIFSTLVVVFIVFQAITALAYSNTLEMLMCNKISGKWLIMEIEGIENIDYYETVYLSSNGCTMPDYAELTAWWLSPTNYKFRVTIYSIDENGSRDSIQEEAKVEFVCQNEFILSADIIAFYVSDTKIYNDMNIETETYIESGSSSARFTLYAREN